MSLISSRIQFLKIAAGGLIAGRASGAPWQELIQGDGLVGWHKTGGAVWAVRDGAIIGRQGSNFASGDIYTDIEWTDFEFEGEWKMPFPANSGIWFHRTASSPGYQIDLLDPSRYGGIVSGSIYRMGTQGRGFIAENRDAASVIPNAWNKVQLRVKAGRITVTQNGKAAADVRDNRFPSGSLGIEVHGGKDYDGMEIGVRNLRVRPI